MAQFYFYIFLAVSLFILLIKKEADDEYKVILIERGDNLITMLHVSDGQLQFAEVDYWRRVKSSVVGSVKSEQQEFGEHADSLGLGGLAMEAIRRSR